MPYYSFIFFHLLDLFFMKYLTITKKKVIIFKKQLILLIMTYSHRSQYIQS